MKTTLRNLLAFVSTLTLIVGCQPKENNYCDNSKRYNVTDPTDWEAYDISQKEAMDMIQRFYDSTKVHRSPEDTVRGLFISKEVLDSIFRDPKLNGLNIYFAQTASNEYKLLFEGSTGTVITYKGGNTTPMLMAKRPTYCPPACGSIPPEPMDTMQ